MQTYRLLVVLGILVVCVSLLCERAEVSGRMEAVLVLDTLALCSVCVCVNNNALSVLCCMCCVGLTHACLDVPMPVHCPVVIHGPSSLFLQRRDSCRDGLKTDRSVFSVHQQTKTKTRIMLQPMNNVSDLTYFYVCGEAIWHL